MKGQSCEAPSVCQFLFELSRHMETTWLLQGWRKKHVLPHYATIWIKVMLVVVHASHYGAYLLFSYCLRILATRCLDFDTSHLHPHWILRNVNNKQLKCSPNQPKDTITVIYQKRTTFTFNAYSIFHLQACRNVTSIFWWDVREILNFIKNNKN